MNTALTWGDIEGIAFAFIWIAAILYVLYAILEDIHDYFSAILEDIHDYFSEDEE